MKVRTGIQAQCLKFFARIAQHQRYTLALTSVQLSRNPRRQTFGASAIHVGIIKALHEHMPHLLWIKHNTKTLARVCIFWIIHH